MSVGEYGFDVEDWGLPVDAAPGEILDFWRTATGREDPVSAVPTGPIDFALSDLYSDAVGRYLRTELGNHLAYFPIPPRDRDND